MRMAERRRNWRPRAVPTSPASRACRRGSNPWLIAWKRWSAADERAAPAVAQAGPARGSSPCRHGRFGDGVE